MRPVTRKGVNKHRSAGAFRANSSKTMGANLRAQPMRGGWRL